MDRKGEWDSVMLVFGERRLCASVYRFVEQVFSRSTRSTEVLMHKLNVKGVGGVWGIGRPAPQRAYPKDNHGRRNDKIIMRG